MLDVCCREDFGSDFAGTLAQGKSGDGAFEGGSGDVGLEEMEGKQVVDFSVLFSRVDLEANIRLFVVEGIEHDESGLRKDLGHVCYLGKRFARDKGR